MRAAATTLALIVATGCGSKTGLAIEQRDLDAGVDAYVSPPDGGVDAGPPPDAGWVCPTEPCDCLAEGHIEWPDVRVCPRFDTPGITACWENRAWLTASCPGRYRFCARIEGDDCVVGERCAETWIGGPGARGRLSVPGMTSNESCAADGALETGVEVCVRVEWEAGGHSGEQELGCFARFGPWCFHDCGPGSVDPSRSDGEWDFGGD